MPAMVTKEIAISFGDLRHVTVECGDCHTVIVLDLIGHLNVTHCPACARDFDPGVHDTLAELARLYRGQEKARHKVAFRIAE